jgi:hypothetical protein
MIKEWFVFKGTHHLGPYSLEEMVELFHNQEINPNTLIWREGQTKWDSFKNTSSFAFIFAPVKRPDIPQDVKPIETKEEFDLPPPLPDIPALPKSSPSHTQNISEEQEELPPPIPLDVIIAQSGQRKQIAEKIEVSSFQPKKWMAFLGAFVFLLVIIWYWKNERSAEVQLKIKGIMPIYLEKLESAATHHSSDFEATAALSLDGNTLWVATNNPSRMQTIIRLESVPKRILGKGPVVVSMKGELNNRSGKFTRMILVQGIKFYSGEYKIQIEARETHWINRKFRSLSRIDFFQSLNKTHKYKSSVLIYSGTPREFEKRIVDYQEKVLADALKPYQEKLERLKTLESLLNTTTQNYLMELDHDKNGKSIKAFEKTYIKEIAPMLQNLVLKTNELMKDPSFNEEEDQNSLAPYKEQVLLGKQIGEMAAEMINKTSKYKTLSASDKIKLKAEFERKARAIKIQIDLNLRKVGDKIQSLVLH